MNEEKKARVGWAEPVLLVLWLALARTRGTFDSILLQGIPGTFYMDEQYYEKIKAIEGVEAAAPEFYLASTSSGCCSVAVQIIGFDPALDFTVQPWIRESYADSVYHMDAGVLTKVGDPA